MIRVLIIAVTAFASLAISGCSSPEILSIRDKEQAVSSPVRKSEVVISNSSFEPNQILINQGQIIKITNLDARLYTIVSNPHPTHDLIPDLYHVIYKNETKTLEFKEAGKFGVHLEENPSVNLEIVVE